MSGREPRRNFAEGTDEKAAGDDGDGRETNGPIDGEALKKRGGQRKYDDQVHVHAGMCEFQQMLPGSSQHRKDRNRLE